MAVTDVAPVEAPPLDDEDDDTLRRIASRPRPQAVPRAVSRKRVERAFLNAFELIGGVPRLALWADQNPTEFYKLYARLLPGGPPKEDNGPINITISWAGPERLSYNKTDVTDV